MASEFGDFTDVVRHQRAVIAQQNLARQYPAERQLDAAALERKERILRAVEAARQIGPAATQLVTPDTTLIRTHTRKTRLLGRLIITTEEVGKAWRLVTETHDLSPGQGLGRTIVDPKPVWQHDGLFLTTGGSLGLFRSSEKEIVDLTGVSLLTEYAEQCKWQVPGLDDIVTGTHGVDAVEASLAYFVILHNLDGQNPPAPPGLQG